MAVNRTVASEKKKPYLNHASTCYHKSMVTLYKTSPFISPFESFAYQFFEDLASLIHG